MNKKYNHIVDRNLVKWGTYGKLGNEPLRFILIKDLSDSHLLHIIEYIKIHLKRYDIEVFQLMQEEAEYRTRNFIFVPDYVETEKNAGVPASRRYIGLTVKIDGIEYWYKNGTTDLDLIIKKPLVKNPFKQVMRIRTDNTEYCVGDTIHIERWYHEEGTPKFNTMGNCVMTKGDVVIEKITIDEETGRDTLWCGWCSTSSTDIANKGIVKKWNSNT